MNAASLRQSRPVRWVIRKVGVHRVVTAVGLVQMPLLALLGAILRRIPRDQSTVALGAPLDRFADNSAYLFVHLSEHCPQLDAVWITGSREVRDRLRGNGWSAELRWSGRGVLACLRAGSFVYSGYRSDINQWLAPGAVTVSLWHGVGIKRVGGGLVGSGSTKRGVLARLALAGQEPPADYFLSSTDYVTREIFSPAFGTPPERCWELGYPRNDHLIQGVAPPDSLVASAQQWKELAAADRVVGIFLTWRGNRVDDVVDEELLLTLAALCRRYGATVAYKAHYNMQPTAVLAENCTLLPTSGDLNAYLGLCDVLITDYSSVAADFLLMRRPVVYFMPDLDEYAEQPGFYFEPERLPGQLTRSSDQLLAAVEEVLNSPKDQAWSDGDQEFLHMLWGDYQGAAAAAVTKALIASARRQPRLAAARP